MTVNIYIDMILRVHIGFLNFLKIHDEIRTTAKFVKEKARYLNLILKLAFFRVITDQNLNIWFCSVWHSYEKRESVGIASWRRFDSRIVTNATSVCPSNHCICSLHTQVVIKYISFRLVFMILLNYRYNLPRSVNIRGICNCG